jgi:hypothetical protein
MCSSTLLTHGAETDPSGGRGPAGDQACGQHAEGGGSGWSKRMTRIEAQIYQQFQAG